VTNPATKPGAPATVRLYLVHGAALTVVAAQNPQPGITGALQALLSGPTTADRALGDTTAIPAGTQLHSARVAGGTATVDLDASFTAGAPLESQMRERVAEIVYTATQFPGIEHVAFAIDGVTQRTLGTVAFMVDPPLGRFELTDALDTVLVEQPAPSATVTSPFRVSGMSDTFEATVNITLRDGNGRVLAATSAQATSGNGTWGTFAASITYARPRSGSGTLEVFDASEGDRAAAHGVTIPVRFG
jgi:hypothetical protein